VSFTLEQEREKAMEWFRGDVDAVNFLGVVARATQVADDLVDETVSIEQKSAWMTELWSLLLAIPTMPYGRAHHLEVLPLILTGVIEWDCSNEWQRAPFRESRIFGYVRREALESLIHYMALVAGGAEWARTVARDVHRWYHLEHAEGETLETWEKEHG